MLTRLDKIERSLNDINLSNPAKEQPLVELKNDWEPFIEIIIGGEKFHAYCDLGSPMSIMPKIVFDLLKLDGMVDYPVFHFHTNGTIMKSLGIIDRSNLDFERSFLKSNGGFINAKYGFMKFIAPINRRFSSQPRKRIPPKGWVILTYLETLDLSFSVPS